MPVVSVNLPLNELAAESCSKCQRSVAGLIFFEVKNEKADEGGEEPPVEIICDTCNAGAPKTWRWDEGPRYIPVHSNQAADANGFRPYPDWNPKPTMLSSYFRNIVLTEDKNECVKCKFLPMIFSANTCERARKMVMKKSTRKSIVGNHHVELRICLSCLSSVKQNYVKLLKEGETLLARFEIPRRDGVHIILDTSCALMESRVRPVTHAEKRIMLKKQERNEKRSYKKLDKKHYPCVIITMVLPHGSPSSTSQEEEQEQLKDKKREAVKKPGAHEKKEIRRKSRKDRNTATGGTDLVDGDQAQSTKSENDNVAMEENTTDEPVVVERIKGKRYIIAQKRRVVRMKRRNNKKGPNVRYEKDTEVNAIKGEEDHSKTDAEKSVDPYEELPQLVDEDDLMGITDDDAQYANFIDDPPAVVERIKGKRYIIAQKRRVVRMKRRNNKKGQWQQKVENSPATPKEDDTKVITITADVLKRLCSPCRKIIDSAVLGDNFEGGDAPPNDEICAGDHCSLDELSC